MFAADDTIVAIATPMGRGGIGVVRLSGPRARHIAERIARPSEPLKPRFATFARVQGRHHGEGRPRTIDDAVVTWFPGPRSYTGEDVVEVSAHGSPVVLRGVVQHAMDCGARLARPGEFTLRAFLNGKQDLVQAEAVGDLIDASTPIQARVAYDQLEGTLTRRIAEIDRQLLDVMAKLEASIDFPDEGYRFIAATEVLDRLGAADATIVGVLEDAGRGRMIREGAMVVIVGRPNVGKSSVFNMLVGHERAIVTPVAGTTRDLVTERVDLAGVPVTLVDTAGAHDAGDVVEREGVARGRRARDAANLLLVVLDSSEPATREDEDVLRETAGHARIVVANKADRPPCWQPHDVGPAVAVSTRDGTGALALTDLIATALTGGEALRDVAGISNVRHIALLDQAHKSLRDAIATASSGAPEEFVAADVAHARDALSEICGAGASDDVLTRIFETFCIGK